MKPVGGEMQRQGGATWGRAWARGGRGSGESARPDERAKPRDARGLRVAPPPRAAEAGREPGAPRGLCRSGQGGCRDRNGTDSTRARGKGIGGARWDLSGVWKKLGSLLRRRSAGYSCADVAGSKSGRSEGAKTGRGSQSRRIVAQAARKNACDEVESKGTVRRRGPAFGRQASADPSRVKA